jgi:predicted ATP-grasp superfamily ATP-dependent carboligase
MRLLICGDRWWQDKDLIKRYIEHYKPSVIIEGEARGADTLARVIGEELGIPVEKYPADWNTLGPKAGPMRNRQMLKEGKPDMVIGFHDDLENSKGTKDMLKISAKAKVKTLHVSHRKETVVEEGV